MSLNPLQSVFNISASSAMAELLNDVESRINLLVKSVPPTDLPIAPDLQQAVSHHLARGGHYIRAKLALQAALALGLSREDAVTLATSVELVHNASLIHDDLQDRDRLRRGQSSVWVAFGDNVAICAGDLLLSMAYRTLIDFSKSHLVPPLMAAMHAKIAQAISGQCADLQTLQNPINSLKIYERIVLAKSGALLSLPIELALVAAEKDDAIAAANKALQFLALGYQIIDDLDDIQNDTVKNSRPASLNICLVLQAAGHPGDCCAMARDICSQHLAEVETLARQLPRGAGDCIIDLKHRLAERI